MVTGTPVGLVEVKPPAGMVLIRLPGVVEVTSTDTVQAPGVAPAWAGTVPPLIWMLFPPETAITLPPQVVSALTGLASVIPAGRVSVQLALSNEKALGLNIVMLKREVFPAMIE